MKLIGLLTFTLLALSTAYAEPAFDVSKATGLIPYRTLKTYAPEQYLLVMRASDAKQKQYFKVYECNRGAKILGDCQPLVNEWFSKGELSQIYKECRQSAIDEAGNSIGFSIVESAMLTSGTMGLVMAPRTLTPEQGVNLALSLGLASMAETARRLTNQRTTEILSQHSALKYIGDRPNQPGLIYEIEMQDYDVLRENLRRALKRKCSKPASDKTLLSPTSDKTLLSPSGNETTESHSTATDPQG